jgi:hypothetical protein
MRFLAALALLFALAAPAAQAAERIVIPVTATSIPGGPTRYSVPVSVGGGPPMQAMLDTGSAGLRVLPGAVEPSRYQLLGGSMKARFASGVELQGALARTNVAVGNFQAGPTIIQVVSSATCLEGREACPASQSAGGVYRINGVYAAILGIGLRPNPADNPLELAGAQAWILILPRPGETGPGELILNPTEADRAGFALYRLEKREAPNRTGWLDNALPACLTWEGDDPVCGPTFLDTGTPYLNLIAEGRQVTWRPGLPAKLAFGEAGGGGPALAMKFGEYPAPPQRHTPPQPGRPRPGLNTGVLPYYSFAVLYDAKAGVIGLKPRP